MKFIVLVSDAYGGRGGIALYNRNLLRALCEYPGVDNVIAIPRSATYDLEELPPRLSYLTQAIGSKLKYFLSCLRAAFREPDIDLIICGHLHLLPFAFLLKLFFKCPVVPVIYGIEAWTPTPHRSVNYLCRKLDTFISIRMLTAGRLIEWAGLDNIDFHYLPNCIDSSMYGLAPKDPVLESLYGIRNKTVIMSAGRLDTVDYERNKGFDEVLEVLPELRKQIPDIAYLIMGDGDDRERLLKKAEALNVKDIVVFTGYVPECQKADHYRLADVFAMPGSNKLFDRYPFRFVFLEALACGVPVVGCRLEDSSEANDPDAKQLIIQVDPNDPEQIKKGIFKALSLNKGELLSGVDKFSYSSYKIRLNKIIRSVITA